MPTHEQTHTHIVAYFFTTFTHTHIAAYFFTTFPAFYLKLNYHLLIFSLYRNSIQLFIFPQFIHYEMY